jgi:hypothetical protein
VNPDSKNPRGAKPYSIVGVRLARPSTKSTQSAISRHFGRTYERRAKAFSQPARTLSNEAVILASFPERKAGNNSMRRIWPSASRADVADFLIKQIEDNTYLRKTPVLTY